MRTQQRNGRKSLTTVQGLKKEFSYNKILKDLKKEFCCNGTVVQDPELGQVTFFLPLMRTFFYNPECQVRLYTPQLIHGPFHENYRPSNLNSLVFTFNSLEMVLQMFLKHRIGSPFQEQRIALNKRTSNSLSLFE